MSYIKFIVLTFDPFLGFIKRFLSSDVIDYHRSVSPPIVHRSLDDRAGGTLETQLSHSQISIPFLVRLSHSSTYTPSL